MATPFDPSAPDPFPEQPTWTQAFELLRGNIGREMRVCLPCRVTRVRGDQTVDLQPLLQVRYVAAETSEDLKPIGHCPVSMPMGADWSVRYPVAVGDTGYAIFCDRSLDFWLAGDGSSVDPVYARTHNLTDAIFVPGLVPRAQQTQELAADLVIRNGSAQVRLEKNGTFQIANQNQELVDLVIQMNRALGALVTTLSTAQTITMLGPQPLWAATQQELLKATAQLNQLTSDLTTLKGG